MTKAFLQRERAELKQTVNLIYSRATAPRRNPGMSNEDLIALLRDIESLALVRMMQNAASGG